MDAKSIYHDKEIAEKIAQELDALRNQIMASRGADDAAYIHRIIKWQRSLAVAGRMVMFASLALHPSWNHLFAGWLPLSLTLVLGAILLGVAKILENMEIGHNVLHGQWDWMGHPEIQSGVWEWDTACPSDQWKHSHNIVHHTWTNVIGRDRDIGYGIMRMSDLQPWSPRYLWQFFYNLALATWFEYGVALHDLELDKVARGERSVQSIRPLIRGQIHKIARQAAKDYLLYPLLAGPFFLYIAAANLLANLIRNVWAYMIIFCGHFPDGVVMFTDDEIQGETRGQWYVRQIMGSCNIKGGKLFHIMSGNLSHQIEHHLFPDMPSLRYQEVAPLVQELARKYQIPYNSHGLARQFGTTIVAIIRYSFPGKPKAGAPEGSAQKDSVAA
jgi:linoleoyl-CoA desaturase